MYVGEVPTFEPVMDLGSFQVGGDTAFVVALVSEDYNFWDSDEEFLCQDSGTGAAEVWRIWWMSLRCSQMKWHTCALPGISLNPSSCVS